MDHTMSRQGSRGLVIAGYLLLKNCNSMTRPCKHIFHGYLSEAKTISTNRYWCNLGIRAIEQIFGAHFCLKRVKNEHKTTPILPLNLHTLFSMLGSFEFHSSLPSFFIRRTPLRRSFRKLKKFFAETIKIIIFIGYFNVLKNFGRTFLTNLII